MIIDVLSLASPKHPVNEDSWLLFEAPQDNSNLVIAAAIDGASTRYSIAILESYLTDKHGITSAAFAATIVRNSLLSHLTVAPEKDLKETLLTANEALREELAHIIGGFSREILAPLRPEVTKDDPRRIRLLLPACVVTLIRINVREQLLDYAHVGDTSLIEVHRDGTVVSHTPDQMRKFDEEMLRFAAELRQEQDLPHFKNAVKLPEVVLKDRENGLRHNYVTPSGDVDLSEGIGALNGLPELAAYIVADRIGFDPVRTFGFCLMTDGLRLPAPLAETAHEEQQRLDRMGALLLQGGPERLFEEMRDMIVADPYYDRYPRINNQDDATGIWIRTPG